MSQLDGSDVQDNETSTTQKHQKYDGPKLNQGNSGDRAMASACYIVDLSSPHSKVHSPCTHDKASRVKVKPTSAADDDQDDDEEDGEGQGGSEMQLQQ